MSVDTPWSSSAQDVEGRRLPCAQRREPAAAAQHTVTGARPMRCMMRCFLQVDTRRRHKQQGRQTLARHGTAQPPIVLLSQQTLWVSSYMENINAASHAQPAVPTSITIRRLHMLAHLDSLPLVSWLDSSGASSALMPTSAAAIVSSSSSAAGSSCGCSTASAALRLQPAALLDLPAAAAALLLPAAAAPFLPALLPRQEVGLLARK